MKRLSVRVVLSHLAVVLLGALVTYLVVRLLAPALWAESMRRTGHGGMGPGDTEMRTQFAEAVDTALLIGAGVGVVLAALFGMLFATRLLRPLASVRAATREMARGRYATDVPVPPDVELGQLATDVNVLGHALAETEARRVRLIGEVAHEMRTPLTVIDGYVEGMTDGVLPTDAESLALLAGETRRLKRLAEDLSALSRAEEGRTDLRLTTGDLRHAVQVAAERLRPQAEDAEVSLIVASGADPVVVSMDGDRIGQVVTNLVGNAIRATPSGGRIEVKSGADAGWAVVTVADTGAGIAAEDLERIFERFFRVPGQSAGTRSGGTGIGLTIARGLIEAHGGSLTAASPGVGQGAVFTVRLPLVTGSSSVH